MIVSVVCCLEDPVVFNLETRVQSSKVNCMYNVRILCHLCEFCTFCTFNYCLMEVHGFKARAGCGFPFFPLAL